PPAIAKVVTQSPVALTERDGASLPGRPFDPRPPRDRPERHFEILERPTEVSLREAEERASLDVRGDDRTFAVEDDLRERPRLESGLAETRVRLHVQRYVARLRRE